MRALLAIARRVPMGGHQRGRHRVAPLPVEAAMPLVACTCIRSVDLRSVVLPDPACPAVAVHAATGAGRR